MPPAGRLLRARRCAYTRRSSTMADPNWRSRAAPVHSSEVLMAATPSPTVSSNPRDYSWPSDELQECPYPFYDALRREGVYRYPGRNEYMVSGWEQIVFVC